jgi:predicted transcriptional regulator
MRTTIELKPEHRARLLELAARRGEKGFSSVIEEAVDDYLRRTTAGEQLRKRAISLRGKLRPAEAERLRSAAARIREHWR